MITVAATGCTDAVLLNDWHVIGLSADVVPGALLPLKKARAIAHHAIERYGFVWVCLGTPAQDIPVFPEWTDDSYKKVACGPYRFCR
jgi:phenylpropionate dioxygenase-like ring-hydroxylating dioxygenase large terminal subunit